MRSVRRTWKAVAAWLGIGALAAGTVMLVSGSAGAGELPVATVTASGHDGNVPANAVDGNLSTRWSGQGDGQWISFDLGTTRPVKSVGIAWHNGHQRVALFDVEASIDGSVWTKVLVGARSSGTTTGLERYVVWPTEPRYVRIVGHGNDAGGVAGTWNSITEASVHDDVPAAPTSAPPPPRPGAKPNAGNTGPRFAVTRTLTAAQALAELRSTGRLDRVRITGQLNLSGSDGRNWVISDSVLEPGGAAYGVQAYFARLSPFTGAQTERMRFEYVEVRGAPVTGGGRNSALFVGSDTIWRFSELYGGVDIMKPFGPVLVEDSYLHGLHCPPEAHSDVIQIVSGTGIVFQRNTLLANVAYGSCGGNAALQTGSVTGPIQARFMDNWADGGNFTFRVGAAGQPVDYWFSGNRHGRGFRFGPVAESTAGKTAGNNVWEDTGQVVW